MLWIRHFRRLVGRPGLVSQFHSSAFWSARKVHKTFKLADIGEGITECEVIRWTTQPQSRIEAFDPLCEVQSDKASVEITSPYDGVVKELLVKEGEVAKVGEGLCVIEVEEEDDVTQRDESSASPPPHIEQEAAQHQDNTSLHVDQTVKTEDPVAPSSPKRRPHPLDPNVPSGGELSPGTNHADVLATPSVRHFARQKEVNLSQLIPGSGKNGRIEKRDIETFLARSAASAQSDAAQTTSARPEEDIAIELGRTRYNMWKAMVKSLEIPHFGYSTSLDLTALHEILPILNAHIPEHYRPSPNHPRQPPVVSPSAFYSPSVPAELPPSAHFTRLTYLPILLKTLSKAMLDWPIFRSSITTVTSPESSSSQKPSFTIRPNADISIALSTPTGLYTPTIQRVNTHSVYSLASQLAHVSHLGRQTPCQLTPSEMPKRGGTLTVSNVGGIGDGEGASPVLVPGGGIAIVAIGRAKWIWDVNRGDGKGERRLKIPVSWSADHRVVEGAELVAFIESWRSWVEAPHRLIAEGV